jgi:RsmE family RNA methyltransferase
VNIILFCPEEVQLPLSRRDARARHLLEVLRLAPGGRFDAGLIDGPRGKGTLAAIEPGRLLITFAWGETPPPLPPLTLIVGLPRPQTARDILREAAALGVGTMHFVTTARGEPGYARSSLWTSGAWEECVINGVAQAFCTRRPVVTHGAPLADILGRLPIGALRLALDNYEASAALADMPVPAGTPVVLALGAERGWAAEERTLLRSAGFNLVHLGSRVLRTETACIAGLTLVKAKCGWL